MPVHEHDCEFCTFIGSYPLRHPHLADGADGPIGIDPWITMADLYLACDNSGYDYIVRYGKYGEYATTNEPAFYIFCVMVGGEERGETYYFFDSMSDPIDLDALAEDFFNAQGN